MPKLDSNIYGIDVNNMAESIASDALSNTAGKEDVWGATTDQEARAKGNTPQYENPEASVTNPGGGSDSLAKAKGN